ncbi:MAG TPA: metallothionein [Tepidisphaeraceae bacterium]
MAATKTPIPDKAAKCACPTCHCPVPAGKGVVRDGKLYCSQTCAYECTETTCVCIHERCGEKK